MEHQGVINKRKVLLLYRTFGPSVNLCGYLQFVEMEKQELIEFRHSGILQVSRKDIAWADIVAFVRGDAYLDEWAAKVCKKAGKYVIYILDDDLLNVPMYLNSGFYYAQKSVKRHIENMMEISDCFASSSWVLLEKYGDRFSNSFHINEPSAFSRQSKEDRNDGKVRIGFAGSWDRGNDIDTIISEALRQIVNAYGDRVVIEFFGANTKIAQELKCTTYPYTESYDEYQGMMEKLDWDIGLAPMPDSEFHSCKYYNKLVEYCGFGIAGVYTNVLPYSGAVKHEVNGLLCENTTESWVSALTRLIEDDKLRKQISENCLTYAEDEYSVHVAADELAANLDALHIPAAIGGKVGVLAVGKLLGVVSWYMEKLKKYGVKTPIVAAQKLAQMIKKGMTK